MLKYNTIPAYLSLSQLITTPTQGKYIETEKHLLHEHVFELLEKTGVPDGNLHRHMENKEN